MYISKYICRSVIKQIGSRGIHLTPIFQSEFDKLYTRPVARWTALDIIKDKFGLYRYNRSRMQDSSVYMYLSISDDLPVLNFLKYCELPDTYFSWFIVTQLHVWMIMTQCSAAGSDGKFINQELVKRLWEDAHERMKKLGRFDIKTQNEVLKDLHGVFLASLFGYDEGLLSDDKVLAAALWRHYFSFTDVDPLILEMMVSYVRTQLKHISGLSSDYLLSRGRIIWKPFDPLIRKEDLPKLKVVKS